MIDLLISDLTELVDVGQKLTNSNKRINNLKNSLDERLIKLKHERTYKPKFPLSLFIHENIFDDVTNDEELKSYNKAVSEYNKELNQGKRLAIKDRTLKSEIGMLINELTLNDIKKLCLTTDVTTEQAEKIYKSLKELPV
ncbi:MAG TPA: hypothetical protein K8V24_01405 [Limosilactobacillus reuteri]|nr:hypothetical protein [Limosilactobacillus reuteri]